MSEIEAANISVHCRGAMLDAVRAKSRADGVPLTKAVPAIIAEWMEAPQAPVAVAAAATPLHDLSIVSFDDLIDELVGRFVQSVSPELLAAAIARAEAAEGQLATIKQMLEGVRPQA